MSIVRGLYLTRRLFPLALPALLVALTCGCAAETEVGDGLDEAPVVAVDMAAAGGKENSGNWGKPGNPNPPIGPAGEEAMLDGERGSDGMQGGVGKIGGPPIPPIGPGGFPPVDMAIGPGGMDAMSGTWTKPGTPNPPIGPGG